MSQDTHARRGHTPEETAEAAYRRIARRKLLERGVPEDQVDDMVEDLVRVGMRFRFDLSRIDPDEEIR